MAGRRTADCDYVYTYTGTGTDSVTTSGTDLYTGHTVLDGATVDVELGFAHKLVIAYRLEKKEENMRSLFRITVVNPKTEEAREYGLVVAKDEETAKLKAVSKGAITGKIEDFDILAECVGDVRAKKDIQKVEVVEGDK